MSSVRKMIVGNWKMNGGSAALNEARVLASELAQTPSRARVAICPPATLVHRLATTLEDSPVEVGGQDCRAEAAGAYTGCVSAEMMADAGASLVIVGHSERRAGFREDDALICRKVEAAVRAGLEPIVCVGETLEEREAGQALEVVGRQVRQSLPKSLSGRPFAVAYEPVWAIGTGHTPTLEQIAEIHGEIRTILRETHGEAGGRAPILYGGSVKPDNARDILSTAEVGGALVGGASLKAQDFLGIIRAVG
ncbi:triose-phosphate isomerase [Brevundimonas lutea]|uniref:triose-phosphate isomerase n=1 Tax=Brevundimonas lutea TaxID=2293980 RepID=UPI000F029DE0|nr:triose-phosphate isomerase [Brevundimonas lutea]